MVTNKCTNLPIYNRTVSTFCNIFEIKYYEINVKNNNVNLNPKMFYKHKILLPQKITGLMLNKFF